MLTSKLPDDRLIQVEHTLIAGGLQAIPVLKFTWEHTERRRIIFGCTNRELFSTLQQPIFIYHL